MRKIEDELIVGYKCSACKSVTDNYHSLCDDCYSKLLKLETTCTKCNSSLALIDNVCIVCRQSKKNISKIYSNYSYSYPIKEVLANIKFQYALRVKKLLPLLIDLSNVNIEEYDAIIPVPSHFFRKFRRVYHPTDIIAKHIATEHNIKLDNALKRTRYTPYQFRLDRTKRSGNIRDAFIYTSKSTYNSVLLIDDIITTGSTIEECASTLKSAGVKRVDCFSICIV